jgi:RimJ/RimL family protein N-acetyltransferase
MEAPTLETERLRLRAFRHADLDAYAAFCADPEVMRYIAAGTPLTRAETWRQMAFFAGHWALLGHGMWALELKDTSALIGRVGFLEPPGWPHFELGWLLGRAFWGHGYALEATREALRYAFDELGRERVISLIRPDNARSVKLAVALGERLAGEVEMFGSRALLYEIRAATRRAALPSRGTARRGRRSP